ncbi:MAG: CYTH domain-containing protein [Muribaculum sp.]|nr:CYTH domain-containing protein [Muribaculum sp.]
MAIEIERKFLVTDDVYKALSVSHQNICQGYLCKDKERTVRIRLKGDEGFLTVKGLTCGCVRREYEYSIPASDAREMLAMCVDAPLEKTRWYVEYDGNLWEVDEFHGQLEGLVTAEIELPSEGAGFSLPAFVGNEVTDDPRYYNSNLSTLDNIKGLSD